MTRRGYKGIAVAVPVTVPYERYSTRGAPWFLGRVLAALMAESGIAGATFDSASSEPTAAGAPAPDAAWSAPVLSGVPSGAADPPATPAASDGLTAGSAVAAAGAPSVEVVGRVSGVSSLNIIAKSPFCSAQQVTPAR